MTVELRPRAPQLSDDWIEAHATNLSRQLPLRARRRRWILSGSAATVVGAVTLATAGPWSSAAFAGWDASPTTPSLNQVTSAESACAALFATLSSLGHPTALPAALPAVTVVDGRGPFTSLAYGSGGSALVCVDGPQILNLSGPGYSIGSATVAAGVGGKAYTLSGTQRTSISRVPTSAPPGPGQASVDLTLSSTADGNPFSIAEGAVGPGVTGVTLTLSDGSSVVSSVSNGTFLAWWPGLASPSRATAS